MVLCLFLDDDEFRHNNLDEAGQDVWRARTADEAIDLLKSHDFAFASLDHDLGERTFVPSEDPNTGYQVAKFIAEMPKPPATIRIHSYNPAGAQRMLDKLKETESAVYFKPYSAKLFD